MKELSKKYAEEVFSDLLEYRHHFHENPELSFEEYETAEFIREKLKEWNVPTLDYVTGTSTVAYLEAEEEGPTVLFRADIDALPVNEQVTWEHMSKKENVMHACGHDFHAATLLAFVECFVKHPDLLQKGKVLFAFQAAEEHLPGGAIQVVKDGALEGVDYAFGQHVGLQPIGTISLAEDHSSAAVGSFDIKIIGKGGHTSSPQNSNNPITAGLDLATAINRITGESMNPLHNATVSVGYIHSGTAVNIVPPDCALGGTVRALEDEDRDMILDKIETYAKSICEMRGCTVEMDIVKGYPALINHPKGVQIVKEAVSELGLNLKINPPGLGGEDFAYMLNAAKEGAFFNVGLGDPENPETLYPNHHPKFHPVEEAQINGLSMFLEIYQIVTK